MFHKNVYMIFNYVMKSLQYRSLLFIFCTNLYLIFVKNKLFIVFYQNKINTYCPHLLLNVSI